MLLCLRLDAWVCENRENLGLIRYRNFLAPGASVPGICRNECLLRWFVAEKIDETQWRQGVADDALHKTLAKSAWELVRLMVIAT